jgi:O-acetyl-ADP-ribose deacetylase (regulator of RNase III)
MPYVLIDRNPSMIAAWQMFFADASDVKIVEGDLTQVVTCDAIVSPANSFGFMDGGVDYAISERLGWDLQEKLQAQIKALPEGELLVGKVLTLPTNDSLILYLICAPTMRIPTDFNINTSLNAYLAMKAVLIECMQNPNLATVAMSGFCTGVGKMPPETSARQMYFAYQEIVLGKRMNFKDFGEAQRYHWEINPQGRIWQ